MSKLTKAQAAWLTILATDGPTKRSKTNVAYTCMRNGWTRWMLRMKDGRLMHPLDAAAASGPDYFEQVDAWLDCITDLGRSALGEQPEVKE